MRERTERVGALIAVLAAVCVASAGPSVVGAGAAERRAASPEPVPAEVIAEGTVYFPDGTFHWRGFETAVEAGAEPAQAPEPFSIIVITEGTVSVGEGPSIPVPAGGALMIEQDPRPLLSSADGAAYWTLQIYNEANSEPDFATGEPFTVTGVPHGARLVRATLAEGDQTSIAATGLPILVLPIDGDIEVAALGGEPAALAVEQSDTFEGDLTITAPTGPATVVAVVLTPPGGGQGAPVAPGAPGEPGGPGGPAPVDTGRPETVVVDMRIDAPSEASAGSTIEVTVTIEPTGISGLESELNVTGIPTDFTGVGELACDFGVQRNVALDPDAPTVVTFQVTVGNPPGGGSCTIQATSGSQFVAGSATEVNIAITG